MDPKFQNDPSALSMLNIRSTNGQNSTAQPVVPLGALAKLQYTVGPLSVNHSGQLPSATISFNLRDGVSSVMPRRRSTARAANAPAFDQHDFQGTAQVFQSSLRA